MKTSEIAEEMRRTLSKLVDLFLERNRQYAGEKDWSANFSRNAELNRILRIDKIITRPYGKSIAMVVDKLDRLTNGLIVQEEGIVTTHLADSIDDAIVYLFITKMLLMEGGKIG